MSEPCYKYDDLAEQFWDNLFDLYDRRDACYEEEQALHKYKNKKHIPVKARITYGRAVVDEVREWKDFLKFITENAEQLNELCDDRMLFAAQLELGIRKELGMPLDGPCDYAVLDAKLAALDDA